MHKPQHLVMQFIAIAVCIKAGNAIECYNCDSTNTADCHEIKSNSPVKPETCTPSKIGQNVGIFLRGITKIDFFNSGNEINVPMVCQKILAEDDKGEKITFRGCQLDGGKTNPCDIVRLKGADLKGVKIEHCSICEKDNCNGSKNLQFNYSSILIPAAIVLYMSRRTIF